MPRDRRLTLCADVSHHCAPEETLFPATTAGWWGRANKSSLVGRRVAFGRPSLFPWSLKEVRTGALESHSHPSVGKDIGTVFLFLNIPVIPI